MNSFLKKIGAGYFFDRPTYQGKKVTGPFFVSRMNGRARKVSKEKIAKKFSKPQQNVV